MLANTFAQQHAGMQEGLLLVTEFCSQGDLFRLLHGKYAPEDHLSSDFCWSRRWAPHGYSMLNEMHLSTCMLLEDLHGVSNQFQHWPLQLLPHWPCNEEPQTVWL